LAIHTANLAYTLIWKGEFEQALQWGERSLCLGQEYGRQGDEGYLRLAIGLPAFLAGQYQVAQEDLNHALVHVKAIESQGVRATVHWSLGSLNLVKKSYQEAEAEFIISKKLYQQVQDNLLGFALSGLGYTYYFMNDLQKSHGYILDVLNFALEFKDYIHLIIILPVAALYLTRMGQTSRAIQIWELARIQPFIANSNWYQQVVAPDILVAASNLSLEEVEKARVTGREMPLWGTAEVLIREIELGMYEPHYDIHQSLKQPISRSFFS
jgi:tetratricopeptide (TPR) repeat protein